MILIAGPFVRRLVVWPEFLEHSIIVLLGYTLKALVCLRGADMKEKLRVLPDNREDTKLGQSLVVQQVVT